MEIGSPKPTPQPLSSDKSCEPVNISITPRFEPKLNSNCLKNSGHLKKVLDQTERRLRLATDYSNNSAATTPGQTSSQLCLNLKQP